ncbi:MAG: hypothetical protein HXY22_00210 [Alphaproteobacteria bacterium]|nr:hypothetical protein [Alphaproteobacteria bacterium]
MLRVSTVLTASFLVLAGAAVAAPMTDEIKASCLKHAGPLANDVYCSCFAAEMGAEPEASQTLFLDVVAAEGVEDAQKEAARAELLKKYGLTEEQFEAKVAELDVPFQRIDTKCQASAPAPAPQ